jgi:hypothetical protein
MAARRRRGYGRSYCRDGLLGLVKLVADDWGTESRRNEAMHFAGPWVSFEGRLREQQLAIERDLETAAAAGQQQRTGDSWRP